MIQIKKFTETNKEFKELARIDNLVNHDVIYHPDDDKRDWKIRDKSIIRNRLLLYDDDKLIGVVYLCLFSSQRTTIENVTYRMYVIHNSLCMLKLNDLMHMNKVKLFLQKQI